MNAREMFEKLGYEQLYNKHDIAYHMEDNNHEFKHIEFLLDNRTFYCDQDFESKNVTMDELKAINQQVKELGWLDEKSNS